MLLKSIFHLSKGMCLLNSSQKLFFWGENGVSVSKSTYRQNMNMVIDIVFYEPM